MAYPITNNDATKLKNPTPRFGTANNSFTGYAPEQQGSWGTSVNQQLRKMDDLNTTFDTIGWQNSKYNVFVQNPFNKPPKTDIDTFKLNVPDWPPRTWLSTYPS